SSAVRRLHRRVSQVGKFVGGFNFLRGGAEARSDLALLLSYETWAFGQLGVLCALSRCVELRQRAIVPDHLKHFAGLEGRPESICYNCYSALNFNDCFHPGHGLRFFGVIALDLSPKHGSAGNNCSKHSGGLNIDAELSSAVNLLAVVEALCSTSDETEVTRILQLHILGSGQMGGLLHKLTV